MKLSFYLLILFVLLFIGGCQTQPPSNETPAPIETLATENMVGGYPAPAYPGPASTVLITRPPEPTIDPNLPVPTPEAGTTTITGHIVSVQTNQPISNIPVALAEIYRNPENQGAFVFDGASSPVTMTDGRGRFILPSVEAREYVIVIGNVEVNRYEIISEATGNARIFDTAADNIVDLGELRVEIDW